MAQLPVMPFSPSATLTKPDGSSYDENDPEFWERADRTFEKHGVPTFGLREHRHMEYPKQLVKARDERGDIRESFERTVVQNEQHHLELVAKEPAWKMTKAEATAYLTAQRNDEARHAAEANYKAERMSEPAKRQYRKRAAASVGHVQE